MMAVKGTPQCKNSLAAIMDKNLGTLCISGAFSNSHRSNASPQATNNVGHVYPEFFPSFNFV